MSLQFGFEWIFGDVTNGRLIVGCITNDAVEAFILPQRPFSAKAALDVLSREPFPRAAHILQSMSFRQTTQNMDMVGHHHIGQHFATLAFEVMQRVCHHLSMPRFAQQAFTVTFIEQPFQFAEAATLELLPFSLFGVGHRDGAIRQLPLP